MLRSVSRGMCAVMVAVVVQAGPVPMPLITDLDTAKAVFVGKMTEIVKDRQEGRILWGRATFEVKEWLKGEKQQPMTAMAVLDGGNDSRIPTVIPSYHAGQEGIWLVKASGEVVGWYGLVGMEHLQEVKDDLAELSKRKWSEPVNGLQLSAMSGSYYGTGIFVTVKNASTSPMYLPRLARFLVTAVARDEAGEEHVFGGGGSVTGSDPLPPNVLRPAEVQYLNIYVFPKDLPAGKCTVTATFTNAIAEWVPPSNRPNNREPLKLWTGKVTTPALTIDYAGAAADGERK